MKTDIEIGNKKYNVKLALTEEDQSEGLKNVENLPKDEGMLFIYPESQDLNFWMQDTLIPLDIIFINEDYIVDKIYQGEPMDETPLQAENVRYVLEVNVDSGIKEGDELFLDDEDDEKDGKFTEETEDEEGNKTVIELMVVLNDRGESQMDLQGGERIFSRKHTKTLAKFAKRAYTSKLDKDYKALGKRVFNYIKYQDTKEDDFVEVKKAKP